MTYLRIAGVVLLAGSLSVACGQQAESGEALMQQLGPIGGSGAICTAFGSDPGVTDFVNGSNGSNGGQPAVNYNGATDAMIIKNSPGDNYGQYTFLGINGGNDIRHAALRWDLTSLPTSTTISGACLWVHVNVPATRSYVAYALQVPWTEQGINWLYSRPFFPWALPGGTGASDLDTDILATIPGGTSGGFWMQLPTSQVQQWVTQPLTNSGVLFVNDAANAQLKIASQQGAIGTRPILRVVH